MTTVTTQASNRITERIRELENRNAELEEVLEAAKRLLRSRSRLDDPFLMQLDRAVNTVELQAEYT